MTESVKDRPTKSHETIFLLTKREQYFYDYIAVSEPASYPVEQERLPSGEYSEGSGRRDGSVHRSGGFPTGATRNLRSVWSLTSEPSAFAHFATMPTRLVETCVKAGTSERGACPGCGEPWRRIIEKGEADRALQRACGGDREGQYDGQARKEYEAAGVQNPSELKARILSGMVEKITVGWEPGCSCGMEPAPCLVLDPFTGTGTTGEVALAMGREFVGVELSPQYAEMAAGRLTVMPTYTGKKKPAKTNPGQMSWLEEAAP